MPAVKGVRGRAPENARGVRLAEAEVNQLDFCFASSTDERKLVLDTVFALREGDLPMLARIALAMQVQRAVVVAIIPFAFVFCHWLFPSSLVLPSPRSCEPC